MAATGKLEFKINHADGKTSFGFETPDRGKLIPFLVLVREFAESANDLHYLKVWKELSSKYEGRIPKDLTNQINLRIQTIEAGGFCLEVNEKEYTPQQIFRLLSNAGFFTTDVKSREHLAGIFRIPPARHLFWYQFIEYCIEVFRIVSSIFSITLELEKQGLVKLTEGDVYVTRNKCIYCLSEQKSFTSEEHVLPESLAGDEIYLPRGIVCDPCNNGVLAGLDDAFLKFEPIAFLCVQFTPYTKAGKLPKANFANISFEKTEPNHISAVIKDKSGKPRNVKNLPDGRTRLHLNMTGKELDWNLIARAIYKMGLGLVAYDLGHEVALDQKFDPARKFILQGGPFDNNMMVSGQVFPNPQIRLLLNRQYGGTGFMALIFGYLFMVNLEAEPKVKQHETVSDPVIDQLAAEMKVEFISLKGTNGD
jgi:hypothetical protein